MLLALAALPALARAQESFDILISLSTDSSLASQPIEDEEILLHRATGLTRLVWPGETFSALTGDPGNTGLHHVFGDLDALHDSGLGGPGGELLFSLTSNELGFLDGDVLGVVDGGYEVVISEAAFMGAAGVDDGNLDIDAIHRYEDGSLLFSFAENESSNTLSGDIAGVVQDGDILLWPAGSAGAELLLTEGQINALVAAAIGSSVSIGDTKGVAVDPFTNDILFTVQSPSAHDGSVFSTAGGGQLVAGLEESSLGFDGGVELDALTVALSTWPTLEVSDAKPQGGSSAVFSITGEAPGAAYLVLFSFSLDVVWYWLPGWGGVTLTEDAVFALALSQAPSLIVVADGLGHASLPLIVPSGPLPLDLMVQAFDIGNPHFSSNPIVVELDQ
jgi:hypothetical protein